MIFGPKPPPMNGATSRTWCSERPSMAARPLRIGIGAWVVSQTVSRCGARVPLRHDAAVLDRRRGAAVVREAAARSRRRPRARAAA